MVRSDLCVYSNAYIFVKGTTTVTDTNNDKSRNKKLVFNNNAPFRLCTSTINNTFINNTEDLILLYQCIICQNIATIIP